jgi:hypothetical protein
MRDSYLRAKLRGKLSRSFLESPGLAATRLGRSAVLLHLGGWVAAQAFILCALFPIVGSWRRREADKAGSLRPCWQLLIAAIAALPMAAAGTTNALTWSAGVKGRKGPLDELCDSPSFDDFFVWRAEDQAEWARPTP